MKICRFNGNRLGVVQGDQVLDVSAALEKLPKLRWPAPKGDLLIANLDKIRPEIERLMGSASKVPLASVQLNSPVTNPTKVLAAPSNYAAHIEEMQGLAEVSAYHALHPGGKEGPPAVRSGVFLKAVSSIAGPAEGVVVRHPDRRTDHELELAVVLGKAGSDIAPEDAMSYVAGYTMGLDMSVRGQEERSLRKSVDTYTLLGPWFVTADEIPDPMNLDFKLTLGSEVRHNSNTSMMLVNIRDLIVYSSRFYSLVPGDVLLSGTAAGVGPVKAGDVMHCEWQGIGTMDVPVRAFAG